MKALIEKLVFGGQGFGRADDGRAAFVWNALPGEEAEWEAAKRRRGVWEAVASRVRGPSPLRRAPKEEHFLSCSPWQILSEGGEALWKQKIAREVYEKIGGFDPGELPLESDLPDGKAGGRMWSYRNKMEFSFMEDDMGELSLAFFRRGTKRLAPIAECALAMPQINIFAQNILAQLRKSDAASEQLKSLVVRANQKGDVMAALFVKDKAVQLPPGIAVYYSDPRTPASRPDELLQEGPSVLEERVAGVPLLYGLLSFFQVNVPVFECAVQDMRPFIRGEDIVDYYGGVGTIGLALKGEWKSCMMVEENEEAVRFAQKNIKRNAAHNCAAHHAPAEKMRDFIESEKVVVCDPPRVGLHPKLILRLAECQPKRIVYLSCNPSTQARDLKALSDAYRIALLKLYNFFPRTAHIEALAVLELKSNMEA